MEDNTQAPQKSGMNMMAVLGGIVVLAVIGVGVYYYMNQSSKSPGMSSEGKNEYTQPTKAMMQFKETPSQAVSPSQAMTSGSVVEVSVKGQNFSFTPNKITAKKGDTVKVTFTSASSFHDFVVDGYNIQTKRVSDGQSDTIQFVADKAGTFEFYCSVGQHRQMGMKGTLVVE